MDVLAVREATAQAVAEVRAGGGPQFIEYRTYRFRAHSMFDAELYRPREEVEEWRMRCPIRTLETRLRQAGLLDDIVLASIEQAVAHEIAEAVDFAERGSWEPVAELGRDVCTGRPG
jgi:TPP-dependent pyruvate/acetoin dehydrogenase alpha subunit